MISTTLPIGEYAKARSNASGGKTSQFFFPSLEIYNSAGYLVYQSHQPSQNEKILRGLPGSLAGLPIQTGAPRLESVIGSIPGFQRYDAELEKTNRPTVISISLEGCRACTTQESAMKWVETLPVAQSANLLVVHVVPPGR